MAKQPERDYLGRYITIPEDYADNQPLIDYLLSFITPHRRELFRKVVQQRTKHVTLVFENIHKAQNASAVIRSADCFGIQDIHFIEEKYQYAVNEDIVKGSSTWVDIYRHPTTQQACDFLHREGYKIAATTPHGECIDIDNLPVEEKIAILFGTELNGLSETALSRADYRVKIPMVGFTESFNLSASAAIILHVTTTKMRRSSHVRWQLTPREQNMVLLTWLYRTVKGVDLIAEKFLNNEHLRP
ncbi:MAG: RNA methyltransferase [Flammeovirgaceae bacterium]|nr:RNA methyltransferase [Flammeovirgaceae bacterium]MDW8286812.1 RNA methyltransferase [Flammeovirgaceae bacterium]